MDHSAHLQQNGRAAGEQHQHPLAHHPHSPHPLQHHHHPVHPHAHSHPVHPPSASFHHHSHSHQSQHQHQHHQQHQHHSMHHQPHPHHLRGHRHSTDSAAADTLLMLSAAAFMDPAAAQSVLDQPQEDKRGHHFGQGHHPAHQSNPQAHGPRRASPSPPPLHQGHARLPMAKTVSAPPLQYHSSSSSSSASSLPPLPRSANHPLRELGEIESTRGHPLSISIPHRQQHSNGASMSNPLSAHTVSSQPASPTRARAVGSAVSISAVNANNSSLPMDLDSPHPSSSAPTPAKGNGISQDEDEEEEEEDEVMSEGVVHVNKTLAPIALSPQSKGPPANYFTHPLPPLPQSISTHSNHWSQQQQQQQDQPKTPRTPKQPRTPKTPKTPRQPKKSQNGQRDSSADFFYSPFPLSSSPASSPSSPSSFHSQLQLLTHNFVSIQPHASPTNRFRRTPSAITPATATPPFSPPASPGVELMRETPFYPGSSANTSPVKDGSANPTTPTSAGFPRSSSGATTPQRSHFKPRWHTQPYMMFLALRAMPDRTAARQELIMAAVELDKKFSAEKGLPRVFTGKTPMNSASACLTNNGDKYFIPFKPEGSRSTHFRLAYQPGNFDTAVGEYNAWMEQLVQRDWPLCFGIPKSRQQSVKEDPAGGRDGESNDKKEEGRPELHRTHSSFESRKRLHGHTEMEQHEDGDNSKKVKAEMDISKDAPQQDESLESTAAEDSKVTDKLQLLDLQKNGSCPPTPTTGVAPYPNPESDRFAFALDLGRGTGSQSFSLQDRLQDLDLSQVPTKLEDIVRVDTSSIPNAGMGLFAVKDLPAGTPLGFYFGVPMTENEFDSLKDGVGQASQYSIMYRRTVLDATDESGQPYTDPLGRLYCPFHFMNEDPNGSVSFITGSVVNQVICTTNRDVKANEELFVFYGKEMDRHWAAQGQDGLGNDGSDSSRKSRGGSRSRASSPSRKPSSTAAAMSVDDAGRPRRETAYKPIRYTR
ncbi:hypothetical protein EMPS_06225 [Entomortierella parvispora]|uniref:SET domain-containing protein n=1 Tax=Entomortierella parvispora TaxID=205924 RepID=A0A9P3LX96_9FUNG|nr:hypothetical protein EMPS_06225 [Entomortierella parvispora]